METARLAQLREALAGTGWVLDARQLGRTLRRGTRSSGGLVLVGTPHYEPWHLTAHLDDEARLSGLPQLAPTLARWSVPDGAPPHLSVTLQRLEAAGRGETVLVVTPDDAPEGLLERAADARRRGATLLSVDGGDTGLADLVHERMVVAPGALTLPRSALESLGGTAAPGGLSFDVAQHLLSAVAGEDDDPRTSSSAAGRGWLARLERALRTGRGTADRDR